MTDDVLFRYRARCLRVVDGDTVDVVLDVGFHQTSTVRVRLLGVDAPELNSADLGDREAALSAKQYLISALQPGTFQTEWPLRVRTEKADSFGRWLADVSLADGLSVNGELLRLGLAREYRR